MVKNADITLAHKKGDWTDTPNYRTAHLASYLRCLKYVETVILCLLLECLSHDLLLAKLV